MLAGDDFKLGEEEKKDGEFEEAEKSGPYWTQEETE